MVEQQFEVQKVTSRITRIKMPYVCAYLVEGDKEAALIDNGWGYGDIKSVAESLTTLPIYTILTHGHSDHGGGSIQFDRAYLPRIDEELERYSCSVKTRIKIMNGVITDGQFTARDILPQRSEPYTLYDEGDIFDLGGVTIRPISVSGHTRGSMVMIMPEERVAIFGDACMNGTLLVQPASSTVKEHLDALYHLKTFESEYDRVLTNHTTFEEPKEILDSNILWAQRIINREDDNLSIRTGNQNVRVARNWYVPHDAFERIGNIKYLVNRIK